MGSLEIKEAQATDSDSPWWKSSPFSPKDLDEKGTYLLILEKPKYQWMTL